MPTQPRPDHRPIVSISERGIFAQRVDIGDPELIEIFCTLADDVAIEVLRQIPDLIVHPCLRLWQPHGDAVDDAGQASLARVIA